MQAHLISEAEAYPSLHLPATVSHAIEDRGPLASISVQTMAADHMDVCTTWRLTTWMAADHMDVYNV